MGRLIQKNNGNTTILVTGEDFNSLSAETNTYYIGVDLGSGEFEKKNPNGDIINLEGAGGSEFTGGTVDGPTVFTNGLTGDSITSESFIGDGSRLGGVVGLSYTDFGFEITSLTPTTINQNITLPYNVDVKYTGPLIVDEGFVLTVPNGTTLTIV
jgi:hypothetical protein